MSWFTILLLGIALAVIVVALLAARQPVVVSYSRSGLVRGPREKAFALVDSLRSWQQWSPWEDLDPNMKRTYTGPETGVGAGYGWTGNRKVGEGRMEIVESVPNERVRLNLAFFKPFAATMVTTFTFSDTPDGTTVVWTSESPNKGAMCRVMGIFMNMDKMMGQQLERGLAQLDAAVRA